jgi:hypothetical protein
MGKKLEGNVLTDCFLARLKTIYQWKGKIFETIEEMVSKFQSGVITNALDIITGKFEVHKHRSIYT